MSSAITVRERHSYSPRQSIAILQFYIDNNRVVLSKGTQEDHSHFFDDLISHLKAKVCLPLFFWRIMFRPSMWNCSPTRSFAKSFLEHSMQEHFRCLSLAVHSLQEHFVVFLFNNCNINKCANAQANERVTRDNPSSATEVLVHIYLGDLMVPLFYSPYKTSFPPFITSITTYFFD